MELKDLVAVSGKGGLWKIIKPTRTGVILESLDEKKNKLIATGNHRVSSLNEISIYTTDEEGSMPLESVLKKIHGEFGDDTGLDAGSTPEEYKGFLKHILPEFDEERVYVSDIKRLVSWYAILQERAPEVFTASEQQEEGGK